jgi:HEAT repeat protein
MNSRVKRLALGVVIGFAVLAGGVWILIHTLGDHETMYQGKPFTYWLEQAESHELALSNQACQVVQSAVMPELLNCLFADTNDSPVRVFLIEQLNALPGVNIIFTRTEGRRTEAANSLGELGAHARSAIPDLIRAIKGRDPVVRAPATKALGEIQCEPDTIIPLLTGLLDDPQDDMPEAAAEALGKFGARSAAAIPKLLELFKVKDKDLHHAVTEALKHIDPAAAAKAGAD